MSKKPKISKKQVSSLLGLFINGKANIKAIVTALFIGASAAMFYEEFYGIGTWHKFNSPPGKISLCFTPPSGCGSLIAQEIVKANKSIYVQAYGLTHNAIINQLKSAANRGVSVNVILDEGNLSDNEAIYHELKASKIKVYRDHMPGIAHNKVMIIDKHIVITGSFNFTTGADKRNAENVIFVDDPNIAAMYLLNWKSRQHNSF